MSLEQDWTGTFLLHAKIGKMVLCWYHGWRLIKCFQWLIIYASLMVLLCYPQPVTPILWSSLDLFFFFFPLQVRRRRERPYLCTWSNFVLYKKKWSFTYKAKWQLNLPFLLLKKRGNDYGICIVDNQENLLYKAWGAHHTPLSVFVCLPWNSVSGVRAPPCHPPSLPPPSSF